MLKLTKMKKINNKINSDIFKIPNLFTLLNIICGITSIFYAIEQDYSISGILILLGMLFDFLDGYSAKLLNQYSEFGEQIDSFADLISFGIAPTILVFVYSYENINLIYKLSLLAFILSIIYRLSKYNLNIKQQKNIFSGLPSTFSGGFIAFLILWFPIVFSYQISFLIFIILAILSITNIPYNKIRIQKINDIIIVGIFIVLYLFFKKYLILLLFVFYFFSGFFNLIVNIIKKNQNDKINTIVINE